MIKVITAYMTLKGLWIAKAASKDIDAAFEALAVAIRDEVRSRG